MLFAIDPSFIRSAARIPRTSTPAELNGEEASACPSTIGAASRTPSTPARALRHRLPVVQRRFKRLNQQMAVETEDLVEQFLAKAVHHRHHDDQRCDAEHDAEKRKAGDDGDKSLFAPRAQIAQRQHPFEGSKWFRAGGVAHRSPSRSGISPDSGRFKPPKTVTGEQIYPPSCAIASSGLSIVRLPSARFFSSIWPVARPFGPTRTCHGIPIRSAVANFAPGRSSRS